jgi:hypothetical protein
VIRRGLSAEGFDLRSEDDERGSVFRDLERLLPGHRRRVTVGDQRTRDDGERRDDRASTQASHHAHDPPAPGVDRAALGSCLDVFRELALQRQTIFRSGIAHAFEREHELARYRSVGALFEPIEQVLQRLVGRGASARHRDRCRVILVGVIVGRRIARPCGANHPAGLGASTRIRWHSRKVRRLTSAAPDSRPSARNGGVEYLSNSSFIASMASIYHHSSMRNLNLAIPLAILLGVACADAVSISPACGPMPIKPDMGPQQIVRNIDSEIVIATWRALNWERHEKWSITVDDYATCMRGAYEP